MTQGNTFLIVNALNQRISLGFLCIATADFIFQTQLVKGIKDFFFNFPII